MKITKDEVDNIAHLSRLKIDDSQIEKMTEQLSRILLYIDKLKDVNVDGVKMVSGAAFINNIPVFIASDPEWAKKFEDANVPIIGDALFQHHHPRSGGPARL